MKQKLEIMSTFVEKMTGKPVLGGYVGDDFLLFASSGDLVEAMIANGSESPIVTPPPPIVINGQCEDVTFAEFDTPAAPIINLK